MFTKSTTIVGKTATGEYKVIMPAGHWNIASAIARGRKSGIIGSMAIEHEVFDGSGGGRGGHDGRWSVDEHDVAAKESDWSEFGKEH